jgi:hypothetical protein
MTRRVTLRIDRLTLSPGTAVDPAALSEALAHELRQALAADGFGALGDGHSVACLTSEPIAAPASSSGGYENALAAAIGRSLRP